MVEELPLPVLALGGASASRERHTRVRVRRPDNPERGRHFVTFAEESQWQGTCRRRYVLVSKTEGGAFPTRWGEDFHWVATFDACNVEAPTAIVVVIESWTWAFSSDEALITYGELAPGEEEPRLPSWAGEFWGVTCGLCCGIDVVEGAVFVSEVDELPPAVRDAYRRYYAAYSRVDGHQLSIAEVEGMTNPSLSLTYGECHFVPVLQLLEALGVRPGDILVDLGSGTGRLLLAAAAAFPSLGCCRGFEVLPGLHDAAILAQRRLGGGCAPLELRQADFFDEDWSNGTIVIAMTLCFPDEMVARLERRMLDLRVGARIVTMHCYFGEILEGEGIQPVVMRNDAPSHRLSMQMSFGETPVYVYERVGLGAATAPLLLDSLD